MYPPCIRHAWYGINLIMQCHCSNVSVMPLAHDPARENAPRLIAEALELLDPHFRLGDLELEIDHLLAISLEDLVALAQPRRVALGVRELHLELRQPLRHLPR